MIRLRKLRTECDPSRALTSDIVVPTPTGLTLEPYQRAAVEYASKRTRTLLADDPGSGKTPMSVSFSNYLPEVHRVLIICPGFLKPHWRNEWLRWDVKRLTVGVCEGTKGEFPNTNVVVVNYDILKAYREQLRAGEWDLMIVDEVHKLKSRKADRTREVWGGIKRNDKKQIVERVTPIPCKRQLALTGTPSLNGKPKELWNMVQALDPNGLGADWFTFANRYCKLLELKRFDPAQGKEVRIGWLWDEADNLDELQRVMRERFMVRRLKADIMSQLPPKRRMIIPIPVDKSIKKALGKEGLDFETARDVNLDKLEQAEFGEYSKAMLNIGLALVEPTVEIIQNDLEEYSKIVCMTYHNAVAEQIANHFGTWAVLCNASVSPMERQDVVDKFRTDPNIRLIVGTLGTMGVGFTMVESHLMIFPERSWVPGDVTQAEDRIHRRGQFEQAVYKHIVLEGGQSQRQVKVLIDKQDRIDKMLDKTTRV